MRKAGDEVEAEQQELTRHAALKTRRLAEQARPKLPDPAGIGCAPTDFRGENPREARPAFREDLIVAPRLALEATPVSPSPADVITGLREDRGAPHQIDGIADPYRKGAEEARRARLRSCKRSRTSWGPVAEIEIGG